MSDPRIHAALATARASVTEDIAANRAPNAREAYRQGAIAHSLPQDRSLVIARREDGTRPEHPARPNVPYRVQGHATAIASEASERARQANWDTARGREVTRLGDTNLQVPSAPIPHEHVGGSGRCEICAHSSDAMRAYLTALTRERNDRGLPLRTPSDRVVVSGSGKARRSVIRAARWDTTSTDNTAHVDAQAIDGPARAFGAKGSYQSSRAWRALYAGHDSPVNACLVADWASKASSRFPRPDASAMLTPKQALALAAYVAQADKATKRRQRWYKRQARKLGVSVREFIATLSE